jgi:hypothetical protein
MLQAMKILEMVNKMVCMIEYSSLGDVNKELPRLALYMDFCSILEHCVLTNFEVLA